MDDKKTLIAWKKEKGNEVVSKTVKLFLLFFCFFLWILAALFASLAAWMLGQDYEYEIFSGFAITPAAFIGSIGVFLFIISSFGILGIYRENICFLRFYQLSLITILALTLCSALVGFAFWPEIKKLLDLQLRKAIINYTEDPKMRRMLDMVQRELKCCGSLTIYDWDSNPYYTCKKRGSFKSCGVPWSCCLPKHERNRQCGYRIRKNLHKRKGKPLSNDIYTLGCLDRGFEYLKNNMYIIGGVAVMATFFFIIAILTLQKFMKQIRKQINVFQMANDVYNWTGNDQNGALGNFASRKGDSDVSIGSEQSS